jgi:hypothetical protein
MTQIDQSGYARAIEIQARCDHVFEALTTLDGLRGWWTPIVSGDGSEGGELAFGFEGLNETITMRVEQATAPVAVSWQCLEHSGHPEWVGTRIFFGIDEVDSSSCVLRLRHEGLIPTLSCYLVCERGWDRFLASLAKHAETGRGNPYRLAAMSSNTR